MSKPRPQWQLQALAAQRRDNELRRAEERRQVAQYFESHTNCSRHHEAWTADGYYERANREAELLSERKIKAAKLEERRKKLEMMLFQENMQYQQEIKALAQQPKLYKNGSYLNKAPTSVLKDINQGIMAKEEQLRRQEAELRLHHAWTLSQPELRAVQSYVNGGRCKSAWMEQLVEKEIQKKKQEEEDRKMLQERDEALRKQIELEEEKLKQKEMQIKELRESLEGQIAELSEKESIVKDLRKQEEREKAILEELQLITSEREALRARLAAERDARVVNMGLYKYKLKRKVAAVLRDIELDLEMLERLRNSVIKDCESERDKASEYKRTLDNACAQLHEHRERERQRQRTIDAMYDGEASQLTRRQDQQWAKESEARAMLMNEVVTTLKRQVQDKIEASRQQQKANVLERERILAQMDSFHQEVKDKEREKQLKASQYSTVTALQCELNSVRRAAAQAEEARAREDALRTSAAAERRLRTEIARAHRAGTKHAWD